MKANSFLSFLLFCLLPASGLDRAGAAPLSTVFTYQGRLVAGGSPANGLFDLSLTLFDANTSGTAVRAPLLVPAVGVSNGLFTAAVDFGPGVFDGSTFWLEVAVRPSGTANPFRTLLPRQRLTGTPYALFAANAETSGRATSVPWSGITGMPPGFADGVDDNTTYRAGAGLLLTGSDFSVNFDNNGSANSVARGDHKHAAGDLTSGVLADERLAGIYSGPLSLVNQSNRFTGDGSALTGVDADSLEGLKADAFWQLGGNAGTRSGIDFLGTTDNRSLEFRVDNVRVLLLEPHATSPNVIGGYQGNFVSPTVVGGTIAGGGTANDGAGQIRTNRLVANYGAIGGGFGHSVDGANGVVGGGQDHLIESAAAYATIAGGRTNIIQRGSQGASIGGGQSNAIQTNAVYSVIGGGFDNQISSGIAAGVISGGRQNLIQAGADYATIPGGLGAAAASYGQYVQANGNFVTNGDAQSSVYVLRNTTSNSLPTELFLDGAGERIKVPMNGRWAFDIIIVASSPANETGAWQIRGLIRNLGGVTMLVGGTPNPINLGGEGTATWAVTAAADDLNDALVVRVNGPAVGGGVARWVATVRTTELIF